MASYSNTNSSNTNNRNKKKHQKAVATNDDDVILEKMKKGITAFYPSLLKDDIWQNLYLENDMGSPTENLKMQDGQLINQL